jgi:hypothetical protein
MTSFEVASEVLAYCSSCKMDLYAVIVNLKKEKVGKVQCLTCKKEHAYKAPKGADVEETPKNLTKTNELSQAIENEWERLMVIQKDTPCVTYKKTHTFSLGDKMKHSQFGEGIVDRIIYPNKIEVIFRRDVKMLIHTGTPYIFEEI